MATLPCADDSCSLHLEINEQNRLTGAVNLDPDGGLVCTPDEGVGVKVNPSPCNSLSLGASGLMVNEHDSEELWVPNNTGNGSAGVTVNPGLDTTINPATFRATYGSAVREITQRSTILYTNTTCRPVNIRIGYVFGFPRFYLANGWQVAIGTRNEYQGVSVFPSVRYDTRSSPFVAGRSLDLTMPGSIYEIRDTVPVGGVRSMAISMFMQIPTPAGTGATGGFSNSIQVFFNAGIFLQTWTYTP